MSAFADKVVNLATTDYPPYFAAQLPEDGAVAAITRAALAKQGYRLVLHYRPWARLMAEVRSGQYDGVMAVWFDDTRARYLAYSHPLVNSVIGFYGNRRKPIDVRSLATLRSYQIGTVSDYKNPDAFTAAHLQEVPADDDLTNLKKLAVGRLDLVLIDKVVANHLLPSLPTRLSAELEWRDPPVATMPLYVGFSRARPETAERLAAFNAGLASLRKSGELKHIIQRFKLAQ
ncbi:substrate-binding periplasmic protein [Vogesella oryzae]|uniref:substrate-binding periplasmic protein n=1 Tax=Vogesella oryzae TaxID=1735285 RepID=UPI0015820437|nr:transporter substrate-binding domain-containing protein [Vogesella oryzae]